jgi:hypothetical protein
MTDRNSDAAIKAMIEHGLRPDADLNEQCLAENARALLEERIVNLEQYQWYMRNVLAEYGLNDFADDTPFSTQLREKLAARDAAQQRAGAVKALNKWANNIASRSQKVTNQSAAAHLWDASIDIAHDAKAIESGEVVL